MRRVILYKTHVLNVISGYVFGGKHPRYWIHVFQCFQHFIMSIFLVVTFRWSSLIKRVLAEQKAGPHIRRPLARRRVRIHGQSRFHCYIRCRTATRCYQLPATPATTQFSDGLMELIVLKGQGLDV